MRISGPSTLLAMWPQLDPDYRSLSEPEKRKIRRITRNMRKKVRQRLRERTRR